MSNGAEVFVHRSQFPESVRAQLLASLRTRQINHKFHYDSVKQAQHWLKMHQRYSPACSDADCAGCYETAMAFTAQAVKAERPLVVGLGCGGGQKETRLLAGLCARQKSPVYAPADSSLPLVLTAWERAQKLVAARDCHPMVLDLATATDLPEVFDGLGSGTAPRIITAFGLMPNFEPPVILSRLASLMRPGDWLLLSANLAPGPDYRAGLEAVLPLYDNADTRAWLWMVMADLGFEARDGALTFRIEPCPVGTGLQRIAAGWRLNRTQTLELDGERFEFAAGEEIRLFYSYRHTADRMNALFRDFKLRPLQHWVAHSEEEGVFLCGRE